MFKPVDILNLNSVLSVPDIENRVFSFYIPDYARGSKLFKSVFRSENNYSANIVKYNGTLFYKDFGEPKALNFISFVRRLFNCSMDEALGRINQDLCLGFESTVPVISNPIIISTGKPTENNIISLSIKKRKWLEHDIEYWNQYHLKIEWLEEASIFPISHFFVERISGTTMCYADKYAYTFNYYYNNGAFRRKIYQPYNKFKWISNIDTTIVQNINNIPRFGENLIITKGLKDSVCWSKLAEIPSVASNNEVTMIPDKVIDKLRTRFRDIYINFDNDSTGIKNSKIFADKYGFKEIIIPSIEGVKDFSDLVKYGINLALKFKDEIFNKNI